MMQKIAGHDLELGDELLADGKVWTVEGWYSAVGHIAAEATDGERRIFSRHDDYVAKRTTPPRFPEREERT